MSSLEPLYTVVAVRKKNAFCIKTDLNFWWAIRAGIVNKPDAAGSGKIKVMEV